jgi:hypothetical protein
MCLVTSVEVLIATGFQRIPPGAVRAAHGAPPTSIR